MIVSQPTPLHCRRCDHLWAGEMLGNVAVDVWLAQMKSTHCPNCGAGWEKINFVTDEARAAAAERKSKQASPEA